jgi:exonuclease VII small subunit
MMTPETDTPLTPSFNEALARLDELARELRTGDLDERLARLPQDVAEAHRLKRILLDRSVEIRAAIACLRGTARPIFPA